MPRHERFKTSVGFIIFFALLAAFGLFSGTIVVLMESPPAPLYMLPISGLVLTALTIVESVVPAVEIEDDTLIVRIARLRKPVRVPLSAVAPYTVERSLMGFTLRRREGFVQVPGAGELITSDGRGVNVPARQLSAKGRARLMAVLTEIGRQP
jgi:hypothetical protein